MALNPYLYGRLQAVFKSVKVGREGLAMVNPRVLRDPVTGALRLFFDEAGENYQVCCPFCRDRRHRLFINHRWGANDPAGRPAWYLAVCYNETACMTAAGNRDALQLLVEGDLSLATAAIRPGEVRRRAEDVDWPGPVTRLDRLPRAHEARAYVRRRGLDPDRVARFYGAAYCADSLFYYARDRIVAPVYQDGKFVMWQARYLGELDWHAKGDAKPRVPKYFNTPGAPKSQFLYNLDEAAAYRTVVVVEGLFDVWSFGPMAVAAFGCAVGFHQRRRLARRCRRASLVLLLDPEEADKPKTRRTLDLLRPSFAGGACVVKLPPGTDPGGLDRSFLRPYVAERARRKGVEVVYDQW